MIQLFGLDISWREILDMSAVALIYYYLISLVRGTRALAVIYGLVLVLLVYYASVELGLHTLNWLLTNFLSSIFLVIIILFQRDIRNALAQVGAGGLLRRKKPQTVYLDELHEACVQMARRKIGALIVIERGMALGDIVERGVEIDAKVTSELLMTIFQPDTPLHDGAVIIRNGRIAAASCILPLSTTPTRDSSIGTRHRAALGLSESADALTIVVSEERGSLSMTASGKLTPLNEERLRKILQAAAGG
ncbi:MAG: diadenylate cyclase [Desulfovibrionales bacterium]|jgi:uncharacterized protein (TIGR00159 family)|nr:diadenylate cyclase [Desulfovibrionales bacterium]